MKWLKLVGGALVAGGLVVVLPELFGAGPRADFAIGERLAGGSVAVPLALIFVGGLLTALTPCVYPLIPITIAIFGGGAKARSRSRAVALTLTYNLGICAMFTALGIAAALAGKAFGSVLGNHWVVIGIAAVLAVLAAAMFGAFNLELPSSLQTRLGGLSKAGFAGAFLMGLFAGVLAAPCTGPVLSGVLLHVATTQNVPLGAMLLFSYSLGIGFPFFLIGAFSLSLPKSGSWMEAVKSIFGIALLTLALLYLRDGFPALRELLTLKAVRAGAEIAGVLVVLGIVLGAVHRGFAPFASEGLAKSLGVLLVVAGLALRPEAPLGRPPAVETGDWSTDESGTLVRAAANKRPVIIDFWADWCAACKELDRFVYTDKQFLAEAKRFSLVKIDGTSEERTPNIEALYEKYKVDGLPTVIFIDSDGKVLHSLTVKGYMPPAEFVRIMEKVR
jgi:thiol:disulfide interchange protein DsbD